MDKDEKFGWLLIVTGAALIVFVLLAAMANGAGTPATEPAMAPGRLVRALIQVESRGDDNAEGDLNLANHAYGCLQIRQPACDDYNRAHVTSYQAKDCLGNRDLSITICQWYLDHYATESRLGHAPTDEDRARIWNGGPNGYKKPSTVGYWIRVQAVLNK